jgi:hypothetical protein
MSIFLFYSVYIVYYVQKIHRYNYTYNYAYTYPVFILCVECLVARILPSCPHHIKG